MNIFSNKLYFAVSLLLLIFYLNCSTSKYSQDPTKWKYFRILAHIQDDSVFLKLQNELDINPPLPSYTLSVNIEDSNPNNHYIVIGDEFDTESIKFPWLHLTSEVRKKLINWKGSNKEDLKISQKTDSTIYLEKSSKSVFPEADYQEKENVK